MNRMNAPFLPPGAYLYYVPLMLKQRYRISKSLRDDLWFLHGTSAYIQDYKMSSLLSDLQC